MGKSKKPKNFSMELITPTQPKEELEMDKLEMNKLEELLKNMFLDKIKTLYKEIKHKEILIRGASELPNAKDYHIFLIDQETDLIKQMVKLGWNSTVKEIFEKSISKSDNGSFEFKINDDDKKIIITSLNNDFNIFKDSYLNMPSDKLYNIMIAAYSAKNDDNLDISIDTDVDFKNTAIALNLEGNIDTMSEADLKQKIVSSIMEKYNQTPNKINSNICKACCSVLKINQLKLSEQKQKSSNEVDHSNSNIASTSAINGTIINPTAPTQNFSSQSPSKIEKPLVDPKLNSSVSPISTVHKLTPEIKEYTAPTSPKPTTPPSQPSSREEVNSIMNDLGLDNLDNPVNTPSFDLESMWKEYGMDKLEKSSSSGVSDSKNSPPTKSLEPQKPKTKHKRSNSDSPTEESPSKKLKSNRYDLRNLEAFSMLEKLANDPTNKNPGEALKFIGKLVRSNYADMNKITILRVDKQKTKEGDKAITKTQTFQFLIETKTEKKLFQLTLDKDSGPSHMDIESRKKQARFLKATQDPKLEDITSDKNIDEFINKTKTSSNFNHSLNEVESVKEKLKGDYQAEKLKGAEKHV